MWEKGKYTPGIFTQRKTKMRVAPVTKWDQPTHDAKSYWYSVVKNLEAQVTKVRHQSSISFPPLSSAPPVKYSASDGDNVDYNLVDCNTQMRNVARELIVRVSPPSPSHNECVRDITPHDLRHVEHINYLKDCDIDNFQLDFLHEENLKDKVDENETHKEEKIQHTKSCSKLYEDVTDNNSPPLNNLTKLLKISNYVNEFLASAKLKIGTTVIPQKSISPEQTSNSHLRQRVNHSLLDQTCDSATNKKDSFENRQFENIDRVEKHHEGDRESEQLQEKHVVFQDIYVNSEEAECWRLRRTRAPSLGVASAVPSFGRILSSLENSDSTDSNSPKDNSSDQDRSNNYVQSPKDSLQIPKKKVMMVTKPKDIPRVHDVKLHANKVSSQLTQGYVKYRKKSKQWPKHSITHVIRALNRMKRRQRVGFEGDYEQYIPIEKSLNSGDYHSDSTIAIRNDEESSTNTSNSSTSSNLSDRKISSTDREKTNSLPPVRGDITNILDGAPISPTIDCKNFEIVDNSLLMKENESVMILAAMPQISAMYPRRRNDKCLACLDTSMKKHSTNHNIFSIWHRDGAISPSESRNVVNNGKNDFHEEKLLSKADDSSSIEFGSNEYPNFQTGYSNDKRDSNDPASIPVMCPSEYAYKYDSVGKPTIPTSSSDRKINPSFEKKNIVSSKSLVSTLSLTPERSKTLSDQDDSDQGIDEAGTMDEGIAELKSKFLAPCHASLNLRPSLEPLKALRGKKPRSIQSRVASLEKTTEYSYDVESDDNDIPVTSGKMNDENKNKPVDKVNDVPDVYTNIAGKPQCKDEFPVLNKISSYTRLSKATTILDHIYSHLSLNTKLWDYNPSDSFRPISPAISLSKIVETAQNSLNGNHNVIETLHILANEYEKRVAERNFIHSKSNVSNTIKIMINIKRLLALLVDSKLYFNPHYALSHLEFPSEQKYSSNSRQLRKVLPVKSYNLIAPILGLPQWHPKHWSAIKDARKLKTSTRTVATISEHQETKGSISESELVTEFDLIVHPPSQRGTSSSEAPKKPHKMKRLNPYATFFIKPRRKVVIWRELTKRDLEGYDPEATLKNRAAKVTDKICSDFCQWLRSLGGFDTTVNEDVLENMFETDFTADACKTMQVSINEMPMIPTVVAAVRNCPGAGEVEIIRRQLREDLKAEKKATKLIGFGTTLPRHLKFLPPKNQIEKNWLRCENIPEDLESMDAVWKNITHLDSVKGFCQWLKPHSKVKPPVVFQNISNSQKNAKNT